MHAAARQPVDSTDSPVKMAPARGVPVILACLLAQAAAVEEAARKNPLLDMYQRETLAYERDAAEAEKAASSYAMRAKNLIGGGSMAAKASANKELEERQAKVWANSVWHVEHMLTDPAPANAGAAAGKASAPYMAAYNDYLAKQGAYDGAAQGYALRAMYDAQQSKHLLSWANQYRLEGNEGAASTFTGEAAAMMKQGEAMKGTAIDYEATAQRIHKVLPQIEAMAGQAAVAAAAGANPAGANPPQFAFPYTVAPPVFF